MSAATQVSMRRAGRGRSEVHAAALPQDSALQPPSIFVFLHRVIAHAIAWVRERRTVAGRARTLRIAETVSLGEKRFVAVIEVDGKRLLIGGSASGVSLLTALGAAKPTFDAALRKARTVRRSAAEAGNEGARVRSRPLLCVALALGAMGGARVRAMAPRAAALAPETAALKAQADTAQADAPIPPPADPATLAAQPRRLASMPPAAPADPNQITITGLGAQSPQWMIVVLLTGLTLIPSLLICMTPFARLLVVFHFLRQALGLQTTPSNQTLVGLSLIMTFFLMQPVGDAIYRDAFVPMQAGRMTALEAAQAGSIPLRKFMAHYVREKDVELFLDLAKEPPPKSIDDVSLRVLLPAYVVSELKSGFQIGAVLFLPFLVVDMVVASITTSVGMMQLPPVVISTPLKLLLFLMVDGWHLLIGSLMRSFA